MCPKANLEPTRTTSQVISRSFGRLQQTKTKSYYLDSYGFVLELLYVQIVPAVVSGFEPITVQSWATIPPPWSKQIYFSALKCNLSACYTSLTFRWLTLTCASQPGVNKNRAKHFYKLKLAKKLSKWLIMNFFTSKVWLVRAMNNLFLSSAKRSSLMLIYWTD